MKARFSWIFLLGSMLLCFSGCGGGSDDPIHSESEPTPEVVKPEIKIPSQISSSGVTFSENKAGSQSVSFSCNDDWTLSITESRSGTSWCKPSATSGKKGDVTITFTVTENTTYDDRSVTVTIKCGTASISFVISQKGIKAMLLTKNEYEVAYQGDTIHVEVKANIDYQTMIAESAQNWIAEQSSRGLTAYKHTFIVKPNEATDKREGIIYFQSKAQKDSVMVYQAYKPAIILKKDEYTVSDVGETITVDIQSNIDYVVQMPEAGWIKQTEKARSLKDNQAFFTINKNESTESRKTQIVFINKEVQVSDTLNVIQNGAPETPIGTGNNITDWNNGSANSGNAVE